MRMRLSRTFSRTREQELSSVPLVFRSAFAYSLVGNSGVRAIRPRFLKSESGLTAGSRGGSISLRLQYSLGRVYNPPRLYFS